MVSLSARSIKSCTQTLSFAASIVEFQINKPSASLGFRHGTGREQTLEAFNDAISQRALQLLAETKQLALSRGGPDALRTPLDGGASTAANILFFKRQTEMFWKNGCKAIPEWEAVAEFSVLEKHMREAAATYLTLHGQSAEEAGEAAAGDLMMWASVHRDGAALMP
eukprot:SAG11_NODE_5083_length_1669_cov_1.604459_1_plen_167_part_00